MTRKFFVALLYIIWLLLLIVVLDIVYAGFFEHLPPLNTKIYLQVDAYSIHRRSDINGLFYELRPNSKKGNYKINSFGMRDAEPIQSKDRYRVLVMGDSVTFGGANMPPEYLFTEVAEKTCNSRSAKIEILNAGVVGYNTQQEFIALSNKYLGLKPDLVIFVFCCNDFGGPAIQYLPQDYVQSDDYVRSRAEMNMHEDVTAYDNLSEIYYLAIILPNQFQLNYKLDRWLLLHSSIYRAISTAEFQRKNSIKNLKDLPNFLLSYDFERVVRAIKQCALDNNFAVKFLILPTSGVYWDKGYLLRCLNANKIGFWDFDSPSAKDKLKMGPDIWRKDGTHLTINGHRAIGELLAEKLLNERR